MNEREKGIIQGLCLAGFYMLKNTAMDEDDVQDFLKSYFITKKSAVEAELDRFTICALFK